MSTLGGVNVSELPTATQKTYGGGVGGISTSAVTVRGGTDDADFLLGGDALLRVYETDETVSPPVRTLLAHQRLVTAEEVAGEDGKVSVAATFADPLWILSRRLVGKSAAGYSRGTSLALVDRGTIASELLAATNAESVSGVRLGTLVASSSTYVSGWFYKPLADCIAELGAPLDGYDWRVRPIEYSGGYYGELDLAPAIGTFRPDAAFEYGDGALNVSTYRRAVTLDGTINRGFSLPAGFPDNAVGNVLQTDHAGSQATRGLLEGVVPTDVSIDLLRQSLLDTHIAVRNGPRQTITFEPVRAVGARVPRLGRDFNVGDIVPFRATITDELGRLRKRINVTSRVYKYNVSVDQAGYGTPSLTVTPT